MNGKQWAKVMRVALERHNDDPDVEQYAAVAVELYPLYFRSFPRNSLLLLVGFELRECQKLVAFLREGARLSGVRSDVRIARLKEIFTSTAHPSRAARPEERIDVRSVGSRNPTPDAAEAIPA